MLWLAAILFFAIRHKAKKWKKVGWFLDFALLLLGVWAVMLAPLPFGWGSVGGLLSEAARWAIGLIGSWAGVVVAPTAAVLLVIVVWFGAHDVIKDHKPDKWAKIMVIAVPVLALLAGGTIAERIVNFVNMVGNVGPTIVTAITT